MRGTVVVAGPGCGSFGELTIGEQRFIEHCPHRKLTEIGTDEDQLLPSIAPGLAGLPERVRFIELASTARPTTIRAGR